MTAGGERRVHAAARLALRATACALLCGVAPCAALADATQTTVEVFARGLANPRGLVASGDKIYVAEVGAPGDVQIRLPVVYGGTGPISTNGKVLELSAGGGRRVLAGGLPNFAAYQGIEVLGVHGVAVHDGVVSYVTGGHPLVPPGVFTLQPNGATRRVCNFVEINRRNPADASNGDAVEPGNPYDLIFLRGAFYVSDGNFNRVVRVMPDGTADVFAQWSNSAVTVGLDADSQGNLYVVQFGAAPYHAGSGRVDRIAPDGHITDGFLHDLQTPIDIAHTPDGSLYVLQFASGFSSKRMRYVAGSGRLLRFHASDPGAEPDVVVTGLMFPTSIAAASDGSLYISNYGMESNQGAGEILHVVPGALPAVAPPTTPPVDSPTEADLLAEVSEAPAPSAANGNTKIVEIVETNDTSQWGYVPRDLTVAMGQTVLFLNKGRMPHTVTNTSGKFDSGLIPPNGTFAWTAQREGDFEYLCTPHPWMRGALKVVPNGAAGEPAPSADVAVAVAHRLIPQPPPAIPPWSALALIPLLTLCALGVNRAIQHH